jgi:hypothetical protein
LFWSTKLSDVEMMANTLHCPIDATIALLCYLISVGSGKLATTQQQSPSPIWGGVSMLPATAEPKFANRPLPQPIPLSEPSLTTSNATGSHCGYCQQPTHRIPPLVLEAPGFAVDDDGLICSVYPFHNSGYTQAPLLTTEDGTNLPDYVSTEVEKLLEEVFGDHLHDNPGTHLDGGIEDN